MGPILGSCGTRCRPSFSTSSRKPFWDRFWPDLGSNLEAFGGAPGPLGGNFLGSCFPMVSWSGFGSDLGPNLAPQTDPRRLQEGSRNRLRSEGLEMLNLCTPPMHFAYFCCRRGPPNGPRTGRKSPWKRTCKQDRGEDPKMDPKRPQLGPPNGSKMASEAVKIQRQFSIEI